MSVELIRNLRHEGEHEAACEQAVRLASLHPDDAKLQYETACVHDFLGKEEEAITYYQAALRAGLPDNLQRGAYLGLGSTYRALGRYADAEKTLRLGLSCFPEANEMRVFLAMTLHNLGDADKAVEMLLALLAATSADEGISEYRRAIALYAEDVNRVWP